MKQRFFTLLLVALSFSSIQAQDVPQVRNTLLTKITATWCPNCGTWGWTFFEELIEDNTGKAIFIAAHHSGELESSAGSFISSNFNAPYQPYFYVGNMNMAVTSSNAAAKRQEIKDLVDLNAASDPLANVGMNATLTPERELTVDYKVEFFEEGEGNFYLGLYIVEDKVIATQASNDPNAQHHFILRNSITAEDFGVAIAEGTIAAAATFTGTETYTIPATWNIENISVVGIIWHKENDTYQFVNVNDLNEFAAPVSVDFISADVLDIQLNPTLASTSTVLNLNLAETTLDVNIQLYNLNGQVVNQVYNGILNNGTSSFTIPTNTLQSGVYFVNIQTADGAVATKKLIIK